MAWAGLRRLSTWISLALIVAGAVLFAVGVFTPWEKGTPIPYAPGDDSSSARAVARTAQGYTSQSITVYEGVIGSLNPDDNGSGNYHLSLASGAPSVYAQQQIDSPPPPHVSIGESIRVWTTTEQDASGTSQNFVVRMEAGGSRWLAGYFSTPTFFEGGSPAPVALLALGGLPLGLALGFSGLAIPYARAVGSSPRRWRGLDHVALWSPAVALLVFVSVLESSRYGGQSFAPDALLPAAIPCVVGLLAGIAALATRKPGQILWPSIAGIVPGAAILVLIGASFAMLVIGGCAVIYC